MKIEARCFVVGKETDPTEAKRKLVEQRPGILVQAFKARTASNESLVEMLCAQTLMATATDALLARRPEIDLLLRLAGTTQISSAIAKTGAVKGRRFLLVTAGPRESMKGLRVPTGWKRAERRELSTEELKQVERAALLNAQKG